MIKGGAALSATGVGAIAGVPAIAVGAAWAAAGSASILAGIHGLTTALSTGSGSTGPPAAKPAAIDKSIVDKWAKGTFNNVEDSIQYHFAKHGSGRTLQQYTDDAVNFFQQNKAQAQWGKWNPNWEPAYRLKIGNRGGYFAADGRVLTYWD